MKRKVITLVWMLAVAATAIAITATWLQWKRRAELNSCLANMRQLEGAAMSHCLENRLPFDQVIPPAAIAAFLKGGVPPQCPSGNAPYPPFDVLHGPRCANSEAHSHAIIIGGCQSGRTAVWSAALCYAAANGLTWTNTVDSRDFRVGFYLGKAIDVCPIETNGYPPFVLSEGPRCPVSAEHNAAPVQPWRNWEYFDEGGRARTNLPISKVSTNDFMHWNQSLGRR